MSTNKTYTDPREPIVIMGNNLNAMLANNNGGFRGVRALGAILLLGMILGFVGFIIALLGVFGVIQAIGVNGLSNKGVGIAASVAALIIGGTIFIAGIRLAMNWPQKMGGVFPAWFIGLFGLFQVVVTVALWSELFIRWPFMPLFVLCFGLSCLYVSYRMINAFSIKAVTYFYKSGLMYDIAKVYELGHGPLARTPFALIRKANDEFNSLVEKNNERPFNKEIKRFIGFSQKEFNRRAYPYLNISERRRWKYGL